MGKPVNTSCRAHEDDALLGAAALRDILIGRDPAAIAGRLTRDQDDAIVAQFEEMRRRDPLADQRKFLRIKFVRGFVRMIAGGDAERENVAEDDAGRNCDDDR